MSGDQQRPLGDTSLAVYGELQRSSRGSEYRRRGNAYRLSCQSYNLQRVRKAQPRMCRKVYFKVFYFQFWFPRDPHGIYAGYISKNTPRRIEQNQ